MQCLHVSSFDYSNLYAHYRSIDDVQNILFHRFLKRLDEIVFARSSIFGICSLLYINTVVFCFSKTHSIFFVLSVFTWILTGEKKTSSPVLVPVLSFSFPLEGKLCLSIPTLASVLVSVWIVGAWISGFSVIAVFTPLSVFLSWKSLRQSKLDWLLFHQLIHPFSPVPLFDWSVVPLLGH